MLYHFIFSFVIESQHFHLLPTTDSIYLHRFIQIVKYREWLCANIWIKGLEELTALPAGTRILFPDGTGLICEGANPPCRGPGKVIEQQCGIEGIQTRFVPAAKKRRGIVCSVEREGVIRQGDEICIITPR